MVEELILLTDYKGNFGSKFNSIPYRSGFDKEVLLSVFCRHEMKVHFMQFSEVNNQNIDWSQKIVLYTGSEEGKYFYKGYIEDIILDLENKGARCIPNHHHLRSNNNKVYMEFYLKSLGINNGLESQAFGCLEEVETAMGKDFFSFPVIVKVPEGAKSRGVFLAKDKKELIRICKKEQYSSDIKSRIFEKIRSYKHEGYQPQSAHQKKIVLQKFIPALANDWKVLIFGNKCFVLHRGMKPNDFRASGSGVGYLSGSKSKIPEQLLDFAKRVYDKMNVPHLSLDLAFDGQKEYLIEFQSLYFGMSTILMSQDYFDFETGNWLSLNTELNLEEIYADSVAHFLNQRV